MPLEFLRMLLESDITHYQLRPLERDIILFEKDRCKIIIKLKILLLPGIYKSM